MFSLASKGASRAIITILPALLLTGCFGTGEGPTPIAGTPAPPPPDIPEGFCDPINFEPECPTVSFTDFEGGVITIEAVDSLPASVSAGNDSTNVGRMIKARATSGATFGGSTIALSTAFDVPAGSSFTMRVYSDRAVNVLLQPEPQGPGTGIEVSHGGTGWEDMTFSLPGLSGTVAGITLIFDNGTLGDFEADPSNWTFYFDDITLVTGGGGGPVTAPTTSAPTPTQDAANVISLFSDAYSDIAVTWPTEWSVPNDTTSDVTIDGGTVKEALNVSFFGIEFTADATGMTHLHMDVWTPNASNLLLKLVDFGGDGFGGGNDTEGVVTFDGASTPALTQEGWVSLDIPLQSFLDNGLASLADITQIVVDPDDGTALYIDNVYFYNDAGGGGGSTPTTAAPVPTQDAVNVVSLYSDGYADITTTWPTDWSVPNDTTSDVTIDGNQTKEVLNVGFFGIEFNLDATGLTHLRMDVWTPDANNLVLKLVDFGGDGFGGGNDTEGVLTFNAASTPALTQGAWVTLDIPLQDFLNNGLAAINDLNQIVVDPADDGSALYIDNVIFYNANAGGGGGGSAPTTGAAPPTQDPANVISLYSDAYTDQAVTWPTPWSVPNDTTSDVTIDGQLAKEHLNVSFIGIEFDVDASTMTHLHVDVWTPDATSLLIKLVDFGGDGFGGGNDTEGVLTFDGASTPALTQGTWVSLDIPLQDFLDNGLGSIADINQVVLDPDPDGTTLYIDNLYFYSDAGGPTTPTTAAPTPTQDAGDVISLFSDAYTDELITWPAPWSVPNDTTSDVTIDGNTTREVLNVSFFGIEFDVDASSMTHLRFDVWTPDASSLLVKLVDFGGDGFGGGNDTEGVLTFDGASTPALTQGSWVSFDIPLQDFLDNGLGSLADINQIVVDPDDGTALYFDNVFFYNANAGSGGTAPTTAAATPTQDPANVISLYSDAYTDVAITWPTPWSVPNDTTGDITVDGQLVKEVTNVSFFGIEFDIDGSSMTHLHFDVWTPDASSLLIKLVDFGGDGFGGGNDTEGVLTFDGASTPALAQGTWVSFDIPLQDFLDNGLGSLADLNQIVVDPDDGTALYFDNVYLYNDNAGGGTSPTTAAATPTQDPANVISLYSDAYTDQAVTWPTPWSVPNDTTSDITVAGQLVKEVTNVSFFGIEFDIDASSMTHVRFDVWTPDATSLLIKLVDFGGDGFGGGNDTEGVLTFDGASTPALAQGTWVSFDIPLQDFLDNGLGSTADLNQIVVDPDDGTALYFDNVYFYNANAGGGATTGEVAINGGFEAGDLSDWAQFPVSADPNEQTVVTSNPRTGTYAGRINNTNPGSASIIKQANRMPVAIGQTVTVKFSARGSFGVGGVAFAEFFAELSGGGVSSAQILGGGPLALDADPNVWTDFEYVIAISTDVSGGITLQLTGTTGGDAASFADVYYDDISMVVSD